MQQIELNDREIMFLSDALNEKSDEIKNEIEILQGELQEDNQNPELDELMIEMSQDLALCTTIQQKIEKYFNSPEFTDISEG